MACPNVCPKFSSIRQTGFFVLILSDYPGLDCAGTVDGTAERLGTQLLNRRDVFFQPCKKLGIGNQAVFDDFGDARGRLPWRQRGQRFEIDDDCTRLMESADHVFPKRVVDGSLAADRCVDLCKQRCRNLDKIDATLIACGGESGNIADHATTESDQHTVTIQVCLAKACRRRFR